MWDDADIEESVAEQPAGEAAPAEEAAAAEATEGDIPATDAPVLGFDPQKLICRHWIRPRSKNYRYIYDYRTNYYNDVIDYLDRRNQGQVVETPRAQTWAERTLRTYIANSPRRLSDCSRDHLLLRHISTGARFHRYHTKSLISRKYSTLGFNIVSV